MDPESWLALHNMSNFSLKLPLRRILEDVRWLGCVLKPGGRALSQFCDRSLVGPRAKSVQPRPTICKRRFLSA